MINDLTHQTIEDIIAVKLRGHNGRETTSVSAN